MNKTKSPDRLKQSKITEFCLKVDNVAGRVASRGMRKRKNSNEVSEVYQISAKKMARYESLSPDIFQISSQRNFNENGTIESRNEFESFLVDDFENDPFLSPRKKESPKRNFLTENFSTNEIWQQEKSEINFETPVKCKVVKATFASDKCLEQILSLRDFKFNGNGVCKLRDVWTSFIFSAGDVVSIQAMSCDGDWVVDNKNGFVIVYPDVTVSSTTLVKSMFCMRQGVFANFFKEMDSKSSGKMLIGRLVHELFQESLKTGARSEEKLGQIIADFLQSRNNLLEIFFCDMNLSDIEREIKQFIPSVKNFLDIYVDKRMEPTGENFNGTIENVLDIEELIKSPILGFQGRVDVTVRVRSKNAEKIIPLELKTGKACFSNEHRSQLTLYILLMNELGRKVDSGLLLYLRDNVMEEIVPARDDIRNLILLRNHFVGFCRSIGTYNLPEPIRNVKCCTKCTYLKICTSYLQGGERDKIPETHPVRSLHAQDIKLSHVDYFVKWYKMLMLEFEETEDITGRNVVSKLTLQPCLEKSNELKFDFLKTIESENKVFGPGTFVHVISEKNKQTCTGQVIEVTDTRISVVTDKRLNDFLDSYKLIAVKSKFFSVNLSNLGWFLREEFQTLRELIIDKRVPGFDKNFVKTDFQEKYLKHLLSLNTEQQKAILKSLLCQDYLLVKGPPGTGKTQTIVILIKILIELNKKVLIASHTHSSVDNILLRLDGIEYLRLGSLKNIHTDIRQNSYAVLRESCSSANDIKKLYERKLIASTCMGIDMNLARKIKFDFCILDESSQILQTEALRPLFFCKKFVLVGDEDQLPPIVRNSKAKKLGMSTSIFKWLANDTATVKLRLQYRMNLAINWLANALTYEGLIECANEKVAKATIQIQNLEGYNREDDWVKEILSDDLEKSVIFVDTSEYFRMKSEHTQSKQRCSFLEANIIMKLISCLIKLGIKRENIGVICPYLDQVTLLKRKLAKENLLEIELNTVDQFQGRDKEVILLSCTKENRSYREASELELLSDKSRLTVAVTRAKNKLIILGDKDTVVKYEPFKKLIKSLKESQFLCLSDGQRDFSWEKFTACE